MAATFVSWSKPQLMKSPNCISTTGRMPIMAAPMAVPTMADSLIGESMMRSGPKRSSRPAVARKAPP